MSSIYAKLQQSRVDLLSVELKKSGHNKFANFHYFELSDFLPTVSKIFNKNGLFSMFNIEKTINEQGIEVEIATLKIISVDDEKEIVFQTPTANADVKGANSIQNLGSKHTYLKRYLYLNALEIAENDGIDATIGKDNKQENKTSNKATLKQIEIIKQLYTDEEVSKMINNLNVKELTEITIEQASKMIKARKGE